jgi:hypothetical protein
MFVRAGDTFGVTRDTVGASGRYITFSHTEDAIFISDGDGTLLYTATLALNDEGQCRIRLDGAEPPLEPWQVLRRALEDVLFGA